MATEILRPNADGDITELYNDNPGDDYEQVDEVEADDYTTWLYCYNTTAYQSSLFHITSPTGSGTINSIKIVFRYKQQGDDYSTYCTPIFKTGGIVYNGTEINEYGGYWWVTKDETFTQNPATSAAWVWADLENLQIGIKLRRDYEPDPYAPFTQIYLEVDYTPAAGLPFMRPVGAGIGTGIN